MAPLSIPATATPALPLRLPRRQMTLSPFQFPSRTIQASASGNRTGFLRMRSRLTAPARRSTQTVFCINLMWKTALQFRFAHGMARAGNRLVQRRLEMSDTRSCSALVRSFTVPILNFRQGISAIVPPSGMELPGFQPPAFRPTIPMQMRLPLRSSMARSMLWWTGTIRI